MFKSDEGREEKRGRKCVPTLPIEYLKQRMSAVAIYVVRDVLRSETGPKKGCNMIENFGEGTSLEGAGGGDRKGGHGGRGNSMNGEQMKMSK